MPAAPLNRPAQKTCAVFFSILLSMWMSGTGFAQAPDLTSGGTPNNSVTINLGPTGMRGWVYHSKGDTSASRQILVKTVDAGSPAEGTLAIDDVILGADGTGATPTQFSSDARKSLALAIADAEASTPATLKLLRWRLGSTSTVSITLQTLGAYAATAPYNCPKSTAILGQGLQHVIASEDSGRYSFGLLSLLAANDPSDPDNAARMTRAQTEAHALVPSASTLSSLMSDEPDLTSQGTWKRGLALVALSEYYLLTGDTEVLPAIEAYAVNISKNHSMLGTVGHAYAGHNSDGSSNGSVNGGYGAVNSNGLGLFLGLMLARECGINHPALAPGIARSARFFGSYAGLGAIPYGEHEPHMVAHESNGKSGLAALCFALEPTRADEARYNTMLATAAASERNQGHTGPFFNYLWAPLGAAVGGEEAASAHFNQISWTLDLSRRWNGEFVYDNLYGEGPNGSESSNTDFTYHDTYYNFRMSTAALLTYALPLRQLHITGRGHAAALQLTSQEVANAVAADNYDASSRTVAQLVSDIGSWSHKMKREAAIELGTRTVDSQVIADLTSLALDTSSGNTSRGGACLALGRINDSASANSRAATLAGLLTDPDKKIRFMAAEGMRYLPSNALMTQVDTMLSVVASTAQPFLPLDEEDPLHLAHGRLAMLLFFSTSNSFGPHGFISREKINTPTPVDRDFLYPAIRAIAQNPTGLMRSSLHETFTNLTAQDLEALADTVVDAIYERAPVDKMFSNRIRKGALQLLQAHNSAEGVPLAILYAQDDGRGFVAAEALNVLELYAGSGTTVTPDPDVVGFCQGYLGTGRNDQAQAVLDAIAADTNPTPAIPLKRIETITVDNPSLTLPDNAAALQVVSEDLAKGDSIYTWSKLSGTGSVAFSSNGAAASKNTTASINNEPDRYVLEVTMSDSRGLTEVSQTVEIALADTDGSVPADVSGPTPSTMTWSSPPSAVSQAQIVMTATTVSDPSGVEYRFIETSGNPGGTSSGWQDSPIYIDEGLTAETTYTYTVQARDKGPNQNSNTPSAPTSATTHAQHLLAVDFGLTGTPVQSGFVGQTNYGQIHATSAGSLTITVLDAAGGSIEGINDKATLAAYPGQDLYRDFFYENVVATDPVTGFTGMKITLSGPAIAANTQYEMEFWVFNEGGKRDCQFEGIDGTTGPNLSAGGPGGDYGGTGDVPTGLDDPYYHLQGVYTSDGSGKLVIGIAPSGASTHTNRPQINALRINTADTTAPTLPSYAIIDDRGGAGVDIGTTVTYTVIFNEAMDATTIGTSDFGNAGTAAVSVDSVTEINPEVFAVQVTPTSRGTLQFQLNAGASLGDASGNALDTSSAIVDDTTIVVFTAYESWAGGEVVSFNVDDNGDGIADGIAWVLGVAGPNENAGSKLPIGTNQSDGSLKIEFSMLNASNRGGTTVSLEFSNDLGAADPWANHQVLVPESSSTVGGVTFDITPNGNMNEVQATIPASAAASSSKLFSRLSVAH